MSNSFFSNRIEADHTHHKSDSYVIKQTDPEYQQEWFCLNCAKALDECPYCEALHLK
jgi:hypothetical protein